ncbi:MAG: OmpA family protein [Syntrophaceae bacterium]|nr:OmpA family protein [Syntrophaceae bacterium]
MKIAYRLLLVLLISTFLFACGGKKEGGVSGKVIDGQAQPISGVIVTFNPVQMTPDAKQPQTRTGGDGSFNMTELMPASEYIITFEGEKWTSKVTRQIKAPGGRQPLPLDPPVVIRFQLLKDGTIIDTKTGLQWLIHTAPDTNANNVASIVDSVEQGGFNDWRLPTKSEIAGLQDPTAAADQEGPKISTKACCVWTKEINSDKIEWDFYIDDKSDLWTSSRMPANDRVVVARTFGAASSIAQAPAVIVQSPAEPAPAPTAATPAPATPAPAPVATTPAPAKPAPKATVSVPAPAEKKEVAVATPAPKPEPEERAPTSAGSSIAVLHFGMNESGINETALDELKDFYNKIKDASGKMVIEGHTDDQGDSATNLKFSLERAVNTWTKLQNMGLSDKIKVEVRGAGGAKPAADNSTQEGRNKNRRVELTFTPS